MIVSEGSLTLFVRQMRIEAQGVVSIVLETANSDDLPTWSPGAHIDLILPNGLIRPYSLYGTPRNTKQWEIAVLRESLSTGGSTYVHDNLRPGDTIQVRGPRNQFSLLPAPNYLLIAGGIGITPLLAMAQELEYKAIQWHLLYGGRRRSSMAFLDVLLEYEDHVTVWPEDYGGLLDLESAIGTCSSETAIYCCGPEALISAVENECQRTSRPNPHVERFKSNPHFETMKHQEDDSAFVVVLSPSGKRFTVPTESTIVEVLQKNHIFVPVDCTEGYCGVCETEVLSGIPDHRDELPADAHTDKSIRICVGRSKTSELELKL